MTTETILDAVAAVEDRVVELRHTLHRHPEPAFQETRTAALVAEVLSELPLSVRTGVNRTGVSALLTGDASRKDSHRERTILLRADMDALPVQEETGLPFSSEVPGVMHACGHDGHTAILLGTAMVLCGLKEDLPGNVRFVFQPAEETTGGAEGMIREGVLENPRVEAALGLHLWGSAPRGIVEYKPGPFMAAPDSFTIRILGRGGHAARPHECVDPVPIAATVIQQFQNLVGRRVNPVLPAVISVCRVSAGNTHNVIPGEAELEGTVRTLDPALREEIPAMMEAVVRQVTAIHGADYRFDYDFRYPPLINDSKITALLRDAAQTVLGRERVREAEYPTMGGEDFAYFAGAVPSTFFFLGIAPEGETIQHHHPAFRVDDTVLKDGIAVFCRAVFDFLERDAVLEQRL